MWGKMKRISIYFLIVVLLGFFSYLFITFSKFDFFPKNPYDKFIDISNIRVVGWEKGSRSWEIYARSASATKDRNITEFEDVTNGMVLKDNEIIIKDIKSPKVLVNTANNNVEAFKESSRDAQALTAMINLKKAVSIAAGQDEANNFSTVKTSHLVYNSKSKKTIADDSLIYEKKYSIKSGRSEIDHEKNTAIFTLNPVMHADEYSVKSTTMEAFFKDDMLNAFQNVNFSINPKKKLKTDIKGDVLFFSTKTHDAQIMDNITLTQKGKIATAKNLSYKDKNKRAILTNNVKIFFRKAEHLLKEKTAKTLKSEEAKEALRERIWASCDILNLSIENGSAIMEGHVLVNQKNKKAKSDFASYDDEKETIYLNGNVHIEKGKEWIKTKSLIISLKKESFEAAGEVETRFILKNKQ